MRRVLILFYFFSFNSEVQTFHHQKYVTRKPRPHSLPIRTGYYYKRINEEPSVVSVFDNNVKYSDVSLHKNMEKNHRSLPEDSTNYKDYKSIRDESSKNKVSEISLEHTKENSKYKPANNEGNSVISLLEPTLTKSEAIKRFIRNSDYHVDVDDLRTDSTMYDGWPYSYRNPYDYNINYDTESAKAKDKRFINDLIEKVIPVHEDQENDVHQIYHNSVAEKQREKENDNPMYGNQPFFSYMLEDYFDRTNEEDPVVFKGLNWNKEFDHSMPYEDIYESNKRVRRLETYDQPQTPLYKYYNAIPYHDNGDKVAVTEKVYNKISYQDDKTIKDKLKENDKRGYNYNGQNYQTFKDFLDTFVNRFGSEAHNKDIDFKMNKTQDKGERKKGFRRVYHKDEYQEDNEFYDNSNNKSTLAENGGSKIHVGGSEAILGSHALAAIGNDGNTIFKNGNKENESFRNRNKISHNNNGHDVDLHRYTNIAKMAAKQNNEDYFNL